MTSVNPRVEMCQFFLKTEAIMIVDKAENSRVLRG